MGGLSEEQKQRIAENKQRALQRRAQNTTAAAAVGTSTGTSHQHKTVGKPLITSAGKSAPKAFASYQPPSSSSNNASKAFTSYRSTASSGNRVGQTTPIERIGGMSSGTFGTSTKGKPNSNASSTSSHTTPSGGGTYSIANKSAPKAFTSYRPSASTGNLSSGNSGASTKGYTNSSGSTTSNTTSSGGGVMQISSIKRIGPPGVISSNQGKVSQPSSRTIQSNYDAKDTGNSTTTNVSASSGSNATVQPSSNGVVASKLGSLFYSSKTSASTQKPTWTSSSYGSSSNNNVNAAKNSSSKPQWQGKVQGQNSNKPQWQKGGQQRNQAFGGGREKQFGASSSAATPSSSTLYGGGGLCGQCVLISRTRFVVKVSFHAKLIDVFKQMSSKSYDATTKNWSFELSEYDKLIEAVKCLRPVVDIQPLPNGICAAFRNQRKGQNGPRQIREANLNSVDSKLVNALMPFQREGVNFAIDNGGRLLLADDMGLGKTIQAICVAAYYRTEWPLLIVTPSSLRYPWAEALEKWLPSLDPDDVNVVLTGKDDIKAGWVTIVSYDLMARNKGKIEAARFKVIILDESHFMKNLKTARSKAALAIVKNATRVVLLSGTPALSRPSELYTQIKAVRPSLVPFQFHDFGVRYCDGKTNPWGWDYSGSSNLGELQLILEETVMIRRMKADVLTQLPSKTRQMVLMDPQIVKTNSKTLKSAAKQMTKSKSNSEQRGALMQYFNETGAAKVPAVKDYVGDLLEGGFKFLVFAHHQVVLDAICECCKSKKQDYIRIDGSTSALKRQDQCDRFQTKHNYGVAVLSITAANAGLTLTAASMVVFAELFWNPGIMIQAEDRVHRIGQKDNVNVRYLIAKGTADDYIWPLVQKKLTVLEEAGLSKDNFSEADTTTFEDPRQTKILSYFERSFFEGDDSGALEELALLEAAEADGIASQPPVSEEESSCNNMTSDRDGPHSSKMPPGRDGGAQSSKMQTDTEGAKSTSKLGKHLDNNSDCYGNQDVPNRCTKSSVIKQSTAPARTKSSTTVAVGEEQKHTNIKRLAKSTNRKFDRWRVQDDNCNKRDDLENFAEEVVTEDSDLDTAVLDAAHDDERDSPSLFDTGTNEDWERDSPSILDVCTNDDSERDSPSLFDMGSPAHKRPKAVFTGPQSPDVWVPPSKKQRNV